MTPEMYNYDDIFEESVEELIVALYGDKETAEEDAPESIKIYECNLEPIQVLDAYSIADSIDEDRWDEDKTQLDEVISAINASVDFEKLNSLMPKLWYADSKKAIILTKEEILKTFDE